eukprot:Colp12_sorted_trinity150504_noHs@1768
MNTEDRDPLFAIDDSGLLCQSRDQARWQGCRAEIGVIRGLYYYEATITDEGLVRIGFSTKAGSLDLGTDKQSFGFGGTGKKSHGRQFEDYGEAFGLNDTIGCLLDLEGLSIAFTKNGRDLGVAFTLPAHFRKSSFYPACVLKNAEVRFNLGDTPFKFLPAGYKGFAKAPLSDQATVVFDQSMKGVNAPTAIILEPSRELAEQTLDNITKFKKYLPAPNVKEALFVGGQSAKGQMDQLREGVDIVVGTPGRIEDLIKTDKLDLSQVRFFVLDEADALISQGQFDLITRMHAGIPKTRPGGGRLQMIVCSATLHSPDVKRLAERVMHFPTWVDLKGIDSVPETVHHV